MVIKSINKDGSTVGRKWERMGAVAPYAYKGFEKCMFQATADAPIQAGTTCDYCGTGIVNVFWVTDSQGKSFKLGCECIKALGSEVLTVLVESKVRELNSIARREKEAQKVADLMPAFNQALEVLKTRPHPNAYFASQGKTLADYALYCSKNSTNLKWAIKQAEGH